MGRGYGPDFCRFSWKRFCPRENTDVDCAKTNVFEKQMRLTFENGLVKEKLLLRLDSVLKNFLVTQVHWWFFRDEVKYNPFVMKWLENIICWFGLEFRDWKLKLKKMTRRWCESKSGRLMFFLLMNYHENCFKAFSQSNLMFQSKTKKLQLSDLNNECFS